MPRVKTLSQVNECVGGALGWQLPPEAVDRLSAVMESIATARIVD